VPRSAPPSPTRRAWLRLAAGSALVLTGCEKLKERRQKTAPVAPAAGRPLKIVTTHPVVADLVRRLAGPGTELVCLLAPGQPLAALARTGTGEAQALTADLVVISGLGLEAALEPTFARVREAKIPLVDLSSVLTPAELLTHQGQPDPHWWLDPAPWARGLEPLAQTLRPLQARRGAHVEQLLAAAQYYYKTTLQDLRSATASAILRRREFLTTKPGWAYLARAVELKAETGTPAESTLAWRMLEEIDPTILRAAGETRLGRGEKLDLSTYHGHTKWLLEMMLEVMR
jgi:ABC-type Zn uptake system ZnuABC Zn-binding protein ZnuA